MYFILRRIKKIHEKKTQTRKKNIKENLQKKHKNKRII